MRKISVSSLKKKAWKIFSEYIRRRGVDFQGFNSCVTCGVRKPWRELQAGHFIGGRTNMILFDERGVHPQCFPCNVHLRGNIPEYFRFMQKKYGDEIIDELRGNQKKNKLFKIGELQEIIKRYSL